MTSLPHHRLAASELGGAYSSGQGVEPLTGRYPQFTIADAYAVQDLQVREWVSRGDRVIGYKVGLSSQAMQRQMGVQQPDFGHLMASMAYTSNVEIDTPLIQPRVEPEVAFVLKRTLAGPGITVAQAISSVDYVVPALEIIDSRIADWNIGIVDTIADNASSGALTLGQRPRLLREVDLELAGAVFYRDGDVVGTGAGGSILGGPINSLVWLANTLGDFGVEISEGSIVLSGSMTPAVPAESGSHFHLDIAGLGSVRAYFPNTTMARR